MTADENRRRTRRRKDAIFRGRRLDSGSRGGGGAKIRIPPASGVEGSGKTPPPPADINAFPKRKKMRLATIPIFFLELAF